MDSQMAVSNLAKLRNVLIIEYTELNYEKLLYAAENSLMNFRQSFTEWLRSFLAKEE